MKSIYRDRISNSKFSIDDIIEDPKDSQFESFKEWYFYYNSPKFSKELLDLLVKNSKMSNWPVEFSTKELLEQNEHKFKKIKCKDLIKCSLEFNVFYFI